MIKQVSCSQSATKPEPESELFGAGIGADRKWNRSWSLPEPELVGAGTGTGRIWNRSWTEPKPVLVGAGTGDATGAGRSRNWIWSELKLVRAGSETVRGRSRTLPAVAWYLYLMVTLSMLRKY